MVISDKLEEINRPERRIFNEDTDNDKTSRTGAPTSIAYPDMGLSTVITKTHRDAEGQKNSYTHTLFNAKVKDM
jgi:transcription initiation factor TFIIIB Brf1 subunit/transcription initiation factor TFIIB